MSCRICEDLNLVRGKVQSGQISRELVASGDAEAVATANVLHLPQRLADFVAYCEVLEAKWLEVLTNAGWSRSITGLTREAAGVTCDGMGQHVIHGSYRGDEGKSPAAGGSAMPRPLDDNRVNGASSLPERDGDEAVAWRRKKAELLEHSGCPTTDVEAVWAVMLEPAEEGAWLRNGKCVEAGGEGEDGGGWGAADGVPGAGTGSTPDPEEVIGVAVQRRGRTKRPRVSTEVSPTPLQVQIAETLCRQHAAATAAAVMRRAEAASADVAAAAAAAAAAASRRQLVEAEAAAAAAASAAGAAAERRMAAVARCEELQRDAMALQVGRPEGVYEAHLQEVGLAGVWQCLVSAAQGAEPMHLGS
jgi:hypothetical protein